MTANKIQYQNKELGKKSGKPVVKTWRYQDANEVKEVVNQHADQINSINSNIDGGGPSSIYLTSQKIDGGTP